MGAAKESGFPNTTTRLLQNLENRVASNCGTISRMMFSEVHMAMLLPSFQDNRDSHPWLFISIPQAIPMSWEWRSAAYLMMADTLVILLKKSNSRW